MKYPISKELKSISIYSGSIVGRLYPMVNFAYGFIKCKSDDFVNVKKFSTPGYDGAEISTLVIEPHKYEGFLPCIMFFYGGGFLMRASAAHYEIAKWYAREFVAYLEKNRENEEIYAYPRTERLVTEEGKHFYDS